MELQELDLYRKFREARTTDGLARMLLSEWENHQTSVDYQRQSGILLLRLGLRKELLTELEKSLRIQAPIAWDLLAEALALSDVNINNEECQAFRDGVRDETQERAFYRCASVAKWHTEFAKGRARNKERKQHKVDEKKKNLLQRLSFYKSSRMLDDEAKLRDQLRKMFPAESNLHSEDPDFQNRWAREILARSKSKPQQVDERLPQPTSTERELLDIWKSEATEATELTMRQDLALMFQFMEAPDWALQIMNAPDETRSGDWLLLELFMQACRFIEALDYLEYLQKHYKDDAECAFAIAYAQARALWHLGNRDSAIELMKSITDVRPGYRRAGILLQEWQENPR